MAKKVTNSQKRIMELMDYYHISQTELCRRTGVQKSALSNYLSGVREPRQNQISLIADPFNINPSWLMGYDAPMFLQPKQAEDIRSLIDPDILEKAENDPQLNEFVQLFLQTSEDDRPALLRILKGLQQKP